MLLPSYGFLLYLNVVCRIFLPEQVIRHPFITHTAVSRIVFSFIEYVAGYTVKSERQDGGSSAEEG